MSTTSCSTSARPRRPAAIRSRSRSTRRRTCIRSRPNIFGVAFGDAARNAQVGYTVDRWGGNSVTRYNWQVDVHSTASDYYYENIPGASDRTQVPPIGNDADAFVGSALDAGIQPLMTIPTIGWTPRADSPLTHPYFAGFSVARYGAQQSVDPYDTDAGNGNHTDGSPITGNDPHDTSTAVDASFQQGWVQHFQSTFGTAASGGVRLLLARQRSHAVELDASRRASGRRRRTTKPGRRQRATAA